MSENWFVVSYIILAIVCFWSFLVSNILYCCGDFQNYLVCLFNPFEMFGFNSSINNSEKRQQFIGIFLLWVFFLHFDLSCFAEINKYYKSVLLNSFFDTISSSFFWNQEWKESLSCVVSETYNNKTLKLYYFGSEKHSSCH